MTGIGEAAPALLMLAAVALAAGGLWTIARRGDRAKGTLMLVAAAVFVGNVLILTL